MNAIMESKDALFKAATAYGRMHGTVFFESQLPCSTFLDHMQVRLGADKFLTYLDGFMEGLEGKFQREYRHLKGVAIEERDAAAKNQQENEVLSECGW